METVLYVLGFAALAAVGLLVSWACGESWGVVHKIRNRSRVDPRGHPGRYR